MTDTNITEEHRRAFSALTSGDCRNFALFSCFCDGRPTAAIAAVTVHPPAVKDGEAEYRVSPLFIGLTPDMTLTDHDGREA